MSVLYRAIHLTGGKPAKWEENQLFIGAEKGDEKTQGSLRQVIRGKKLRVSPS